MSRVDYEDVSVDLTEDDKIEYFADRKKAHAEIGKLAITKSRINQRIKDRTQDAEKTAANCTNILRAGTHVVCCKVVLDHHDGKARYYREDTGLFVRSRSLTKEERQAVLDFDTAPPVPARGSSGKLADVPAVAEAVDKLRKSAQDAADRHGGEVSVVVGGEKTTLAKPKKGGGERLADVSAEKPAAAPVVDVGKCSGCGCTDEAPCKDGCWWANVDCSLCSRCSTETPDVDVLLTRTLGPFRTRTELVTRLGEEGAKNVVEAIENGGNPDKVIASEIASQKDRRRDTVLAVLNGFGQGTGEIAERCGLPDTDVAAALVELKKAGKAKTLRGTRKWVVVLGSDDE